MSAVKHLYVHIPVCLSKCNYCGFYSVPVEQAGDLTCLVSSVLEEARIREALGLDLETLYVGGGTPSLLGAANLARLGKALRAGEASEATVEVNPATVGPGDLEAICEAGFNRVSIGIQSLDDGVLAMLGRRHTAEEGLSLVARAVAMNLRVSIDLLYGLPGQTPDRWRGDLSRATGLGVNHLSCYELTLEHGTRLAEDVARGLELPKGRDEGEWFELTHEVLQGLGFDAYEVSSFARSDNDRSRHNQAYWQRRQYLGLGPSAHGFVNNVRYWNHRSIHKWQKALQAGLTPEGGHERLTPEQAVLEVLMLGLRTVDGVSLESLRELVNEPTIKTIVHRALALPNLLQVTSTCLVPTRKGLLQADHLPLLLF